MRILKLLLALVVLAAIGFVGLLIYAYFGDMTPDRRQVSEPVILNVD